MANKSKPVTMEEVNALHNEWWNSLTDEQKQKLVDEQEAKRHELSAVSLFESSEIAGLGQLIDAALNSDRLVNFG